MTFYKADKCIHFTGISNKACKVGISYEGFSGGLPCIAPGKNDQSCASRVYPTVEQIADSEQALKERLEKFAKVMVPVNEWRKSVGWSKKRKVSATGTVPCPACGTGTIHLSMAAYNGHVWGKCTTKGCVSWME